MMSPETPAVLSGRSFGAEADGAWMGLYARSGQGVAGVVWIVRLIQEYYEII
jgi:hypothetical protein